jgi:hypothetical protein
MSEQAERSARELAAAFEAEYKATGNEAAKLQAARWRRRAALRAKCRGLAGEIAEISPHSLWSDWVVSIVEALEQARDPEVVTVDEFERDVLRVIRTAMDARLITGSW